MGVEFKGIKAKEGGCIYAGEAITNSMDFALLSTKQREKLAVAYANYNKVLDEIEKNAEAVAETFNSIAELLKGVKNNISNIVTKLKNNQSASKSDISKTEAINKNAKSKLEIALKLFESQYPGTKDEFQLKRKQQIQKSISLIGNSTSCLVNNNSNKPSEEKKGPSWLNVMVENPCADSLSELANFDFDLLIDNIALMEEDSKFAKEILDVTKFTLDVKNKSTDKKPETLDLKPNFDIHFSKMQAIADRFSAPKPQVDTKRYQVDNITVNLNGKNAKIKHFILGYEGDFTINLNEFSQDNIKGNAQDKLLFVGAQANKKELLGIQGTKKDVKTVYDYLSPNKGKLTGKQLKEIFPGTSQARCDEVAALINKYAVEYGLTTPERLSHFIGQIGAETQLKFLDEGSYSAARILTAEKTRTTYSSGGKRYLKYCSLFNGHTAGQGCPYPACNPKIEVPKDDYAGGYNYATTEFMNKLPSVKPEIVDELPRDPDFFSIVYACQLNNGGIETGDGYRFRGRGFIQITGQANYQTMVQNKWDAVHGKSSKDFMCRSTECDNNLDDIANDLDFSMLISLTFWKSGNTNDLANEINKKSIEDVTEAVNGRQIGIEHRTKYTNKAYEILKK